MLSYEYSSDGIPSRNAIIARYSSDEYWSKWFLSCQMAVTAPSSVLASWSGSPILPIISRNPSAAIGETVTPNEVY